MEREREGERERLHVRIFEIDREERTLGDKGLKREGEREVFWVSN